MLLADDIPTIFLPQYVITCECRKFMDLTTILIPKAAYHAKQADRVEIIGTHQSIDTLAIHRDDRV
jgi:hypothetical protein